MKTLLRLCVDSSDYYRQSIGTGATRRTCAPS